jgi:hypothetical protein
MLGDLDGDGRAELIVWRPGKWNLVLAHCGQRIQYAAQSQEAWEHRRHSNDQVARARRSRSRSPCSSSWASSNATAQLSRRVYASGFTSPVAFVQDPSDRTGQYVVQQGGLIFALKNGVIQGTPFLDLAASSPRGRRWPPRPRVPARLRDERAGSM